jgi:hypothetical protein
VSDPDPATVAFNGIVMTARVDGECACEARRIDDGLIFGFGEGSLMVDMAADGTNVRWEPAGGGSRVPLDRYLLEGGVSSYIAHREAPVDAAELYDVDRAEVP